MKEVVKIEKVEKLNFKVSELDQRIQDEFFTRLKEDNTKVDPIEYAELSKNIVQLPMCEVYRVIPAATGILEKSVIDVEKKTEVDKSDEAELDIRETIVTVENTTTHQSYDVSVALDDEGGLV